MWSFLRRVRFVLIMALLGTGMVVSPMLVTGQTNNDASPPPAASPSDKLRAGAQTSVQRLTTASLPNAIRLHDDLITGGLPEGEAAFRELKSLGIVTIISVDGARPDTATAARYGLRYVHLPHGYDGIHPQRRRELAKALRELPKPIYIHCHHGKHRSPAAGASACVGVGWLTPEQGLDALTLAGTNPDYVGLFEAVQTATRYPDDELDQLKVVYRETVEIPAVAEAMVAIDHYWEQLRSRERSGWDLAASQALAVRREALLLREHFAEMMRHEEVKSRSLPFQKAISEAKDRVVAFEEALNTLPFSSSEVSRRFSAIERNCVECHRQHRDRAGPATPR